jgi:hypothetical protein
MPDENPTYSHANVKRAHQPDYDGYAGSGRAHLHFGTFVVVVGS